jgi:hypothetical protein
LRKDPLAAAVESAVSGEPASPSWYAFPGDPIRSDFRNYLYLVWEHLGLPDPTNAQYEMAYFLQHGYFGFIELPSGRIVKRYDEEWDDVSAEEQAQGRPLDEPRETYRSDILEGFRGIGKSYISAAFCTWLFLRDPINEKILIVSASGPKAKEFVAQAKSLIMTMDILAHLRPGAPGWTSTSRDQIDRFDVAGHSISQSPSLKAAGITGQITGSRATRIFPDDIEIPDNSKTEEARESLLRLVNEFDAIILPGSGTQITFLGTPQTEESIYNRLIRERGFNAFVWPARYPKIDKRPTYIHTRDSGDRHDTLAPALRALDAHPELSMRPTDPMRFGEVQLAAREAKGRSWFALQYMLDTTLSDAERYPLKQFDLIVMSTNFMKAPLTVQWGKDSDKKNVRSDIPNVGFSGDYLIGPLFVDKEWREYTAKTLFVDPSGRGKDETAWAVVAELHGMLYVLKVGGHAGDVNTAMEKIAMDAKAYNVSNILVEPNYGGVIWISAFSPVLARVGKGWSCAVDEAEWSQTQKEVRIIDTLEPVMNQHRLVVDESVAKDQTFIYQLTHVSREKGSLTHDDRLDAVAGAVASLAASLMIDSAQSRKEKLDEELDAQLEDFIETCRIAGTAGVRTGRVLNNQVLGGEDEGHYFSTRYS